MSSIDAPNDPERLRRHLRALSSVNEQLHAQLESRTLSVRRPTVGGQWIEQLQLLGSVSDPFLVRSVQRGNFLIEHPMRREIKAGMIYAALEGVLGAGRVIADADLEQWSEGPPVEVLEANFGPAFIVVAGRRLTIRGLPLPFSVTAEEMMRFPEGEELRVGTAAISARGTGLLARARGVARRDGATSALKRAVRKIARKVRSVAR